MVIYFLYFVIGFVIECKWEWSGSGSGYIFLIGYYKWARRKKCEWLLELYLALNKMKKHVLTCDGI